MTATDTPLTCEVAAQLHNNGWSPLPLPPRAKSHPPTGYTGYAGRYTTTTDINGWTWDGNVAIRLPPDVIGIDVDVYHGGDTGIADLEQAHGKLPLTVWSTSREDGSGIALFRVPAGTTLATDPAQGVDMIQAHHRYMVVWPSTHPEGRIYQWIDEQSGDYLEGPPEPAELPDLPWEWVEALSVTKTAAANAATPTVVRQFIEDHTTNTRPNALYGIKTRLADYTGGRHDTLVQVACWAMRESAAGYYPANEAIDTLAAWWKITMHAEPKRRDGGELASAIMWAVAQTLAEPERIAELRNQPPPGVNPETGEISRALNLPDEFWNARPVLQHIRQAAHNRLVSADAVLVASLARITAITHRSIVIPAMVGTPASINMFVAVIDPSGGGKSAAISLARTLIPIHNDDIIDPLMPSSGEGMIEAFFEWVNEEDDEGKTRKVKRQTKKGAYAVVDEGQSLLAQSDRSGSIILETIRSAWIGGDLGQHNAAEERRRLIPAHNYRLSLVIGFQLAYAAHLISDGEGGTPQRFTFTLATDPTVDFDAKWPGPITTHPVAGVDIGVKPLDIDPDIVAGVRQRRYERSNGTLKVNPLDTHADLRRLKLAAALGLLDGRSNITIDDWDLAGMIDATSCAVRSMVIEYDRQASASSRKAATAIAIERDEAIETAHISRTIRRVSRIVARHVWKEGPMTEAAAYRQVASRDRPHAPKTAVMDAAVEAKWVTIDTDRNVTRGEQAP